jgi:hypothetical protein
MKKIFYSLTVIFCFLFATVSFSKNDSDENIQTVDNSLVIDRIGNADIEVTIPSFIVTFRDTEIKVKFKDPNHTKLALNKNKIHFIINGDDKELTFVNGETSFLHKFNDSKSLSIYVEDFNYNQNVTAYPLWALLLPVILIVLWIIRAKMKRNKE